MATRQFISRKARFGNLRVLKNLFGDGSKIHADEIILGSKGSHQTLSALIEPGVFTPYFNVGNHVYGEQIGRYYKIGNIVHIFMRLQIITDDKTPVDDLKIVGLPFPVYGHGGSLTFGYINNTSMPTNKPILMGRITGYTSEISLTARGHENQWPTACKASILNNGSEWYMSGSYLVGE